MEGKFNSKLGLILSIIVIFCTHFFFYPKWQKAGTEATLSWDVSGYYYYLPAFFIYKDVKELAWRDGIQEKYQPASSMYQAFRHKDGPFVMKYSLGLAIQYLPAFAIAHSIASISDTWEADGFSFPYQIAISIWSLLVSILGLIFLRKVLREYFKDHIVASVLVLLTIGTNYLNYSAIDGAMSHNFLFTLYTLLMWSSLKFHQRPSFKWAIAIGSLVGLAALTRPTEIIIALIPMLWGVKNIEDLRHRWKFILKQKKYFILAILMTGAIGFLQPMYWQYATGEWLVYSYEEQGFSWLRPHFKDGLFSAKKGWLVYTPLMLFALYGFFPLLKKNHDSFWAIVLTCGLIIYITFAWDIWWYGGSLGQRAMVQSYALFALPLAAALQKIDGAKNWIKIVVVTIISLFSYYNIWLTYQAHGGGLLDPENMTKAYFWKVLGRYDQPIETKKLLDNRDAYYGVQKDVKILYENNFENDSLALCKDQPIAGNQSLCLNNETQYSPLYTAKLINGEAKWVRAHTTFKALNKEWDVWKMTQMMIRFYNQDQQVKQRIIRLHRLIEGNETKSVFMDAKCPRSTFDRVELLFWNAGSDKTIYLDDIRLEQFNE